MRNAGCVVGEYVGGGQGELENVDPNVPTSSDVVNADEPVVDDETLAEVDGSNDGQPLLFFYDCETTGLSIYNDHITDIAAKVIASPVPVPTPTFSSLVMTSRQIPAAGNFLIL